MGKSRISIFEGERGIGGETLTEFHRRHRGDTTKKNKNHRREIGYLSCQSVRIVVEDTNAEDGASQKSEM